MGRNHPRVVIVGAGFGGLQAAQILGKREADVVLVDRQPYHLFTPLLHQVATAELEPSQIAFPIRRLLRSTPQAQFCLAEVTGINWGEQVLITDQTQIPFDFLILATGSSPHLSSVSGAAQHTLSLKTLPQAIKLRNHVLHCFEQAMLTADPVERQSWLTFIIIGGGTTGVELAGSWAEWIQESLTKDYPQIHPTETRLVLLHSSDRLVNCLAPPLSRYTQAQLQRLGVEVWLQSPVVQITADTVHLKSGDRFVAKTIVWAAGMQVAVPDHWKLPVNHEGRVNVTSCLNLSDLPQVYVIGDLANVQQNGMTLPMLAPVAVAQGETAAHNILRQLRGQAALPYQHVDRGQMAILSRHRAVVQRGKFTMTGFPAWLLWLGFHWLLLPSIKQRLITLVHWLGNYVQRDRVACSVLSSSHQSSDSEPSL
jgi:NADH dehydrogenase